MNINEAISNQDLGRSLLQNQRTIIEQNAKIIAQQAELRKAEAEDGGRRKEKVPSFVKVSTFHIFTNTNNPYCNITRKNLAVLNMVHYCSLTILVCGMYIVAGSGIC